MKLIVFSWLLIICVSCLNMNRPESQERYQTLRNQFSPELLEHFPINLPNNQIGFGFSSYYKDEVPGSLYLKTKFFSKAKYMEKKNSFASRARFQLLSTDTCLFIIEKDWQNHKCKNHYPVPVQAIGDLFDERTKKKEMNLFILKTELGNFVKDGSDTLNIDLPTGMKKGFSAGITTNDQENSINYWVVIW